MIFHDYILKTWELFLKTFCSHCRLTQNLFFPDASIRGAAELSFHPAQLNLWQRFSMWGPSKISGLQNHWQNCENANSWTHHLPTQSTPPRVGPDYLLFSQAPQVVLSILGISYIFHVFVCPFIKHFFNTFCWSQPVKLFFMLDNGKGEKNMIWKLTWSQLRLHQQRSRGEGVEPLLGRQSPGSLQEVICQDGRALSLETDLARGVTVPPSIPECSGPWTWLSQPFPPHSPVTTHFHSCLHKKGHQETELSRETGGFLVASGISLKLPEEHFTKRQVTWFTVQQPESKPPFDTHQTVFPLSWVLVWSHFLLFFSFSLFFF